ncbi:MAG TPA: NAD(P)/FAD-dependent oxidoreductase [Afifellaceae bacterium]|nr:NAD(P)/FAD-dependent oxidoreductase [Afifellaceae bacterium]
MKTSVAIIGAGPAGTASAMFLKAHGIDSVIVEKETFPRFHIGESMTGECGASVRALGLEEEMLRCGFPVKRYAAVYGAKGTKWGLPVAGRDKDWNLFPQFTWQVRRAEFDKMLLDNAIARGVGFVHGQVKEPIVGDDGSVQGLRVWAADGGAIDIHSEMVLDCSGQSTYLANTGITGPKYVGNYDKQIAIFSQIAGAIRDETPTPNDTLIFYQKKHHWAWFIPLTDETVSVGTVIPAAYFKDKNESKADFLKRELRELNPDLTRRVVDSTIVEQTRSIANYSYQVRNFTGKGFICVGDAHRFVDPIYSFGLCISFAEAKAAADAVKDYLNGVGRDDPAPFAHYEREREGGIDIVEDMMDAFWEHPLGFAAVVRAHTDEMTDIFAGRLWERQPNVAIDKLRRMLERERAHAAGSADALPVGSRYHPERAHIWEHETA